MRRGGSSRRAAAVAAALACSLLVGCPGPDGDGDSSSTLGDPPVGVVPAPASACVDNGDATYDPAELPALSVDGLTVAFLVNRPGALVQAADGPGAPSDPPLWPLRPEPLADDRVLFVAPQDPAAAWYGDRFPDGELTAPLDASEGTWAVYRRDGDEGDDDDDGDDAAALLLLGLASDEAGDTALRYEPAVPLLRLPLQAGDQWTADAAASGLSDGEPWPRDLGADGVVSLVHRYSFDVVDFGIAALPGADLPAWRLDVAVQTEAHNSIVGLFASETRRMRLYVSPCLGVVARVRSQEGELDPNFTVATELLRFGLDPELLPEPPAGPPDEGGAL